MESALLGVVLDSSTVIAAERRNLPLPQLIEAIQTAHGEIEISLSPVTVDGIYRAKTPEASQRRRAYIEEMADLVPVHPVTKEMAFLVGRIQGQEAAKGNVLPLNDLMIAACHHPRDRATEPARLQALHPHLAGRSAAGTVPSRGLTAVRQDRQGDDRRAGDSG
jgi:predicted nucleic acid-binding protein